METEKVYNRTNVRILSERDRGNMGRVILHCDLNNFYASVECRDYPHLNGNPVAVCGKQEDRHGIVLAKNELVKQYGVKTGDPVFRAQKKCPDLVVTLPHYDRYLYFSNLAKKIYSSYTDQIEPFGIDECWLDVTGSQRLFGTPYEIAEKIRNQLYSQLGLTISVGVSFNKVFAKLASDLKKPNATTVIAENNFQEIVWKLPVEWMLGIGHATLKKLRSVGIVTIGDLASSNPNYLYAMLGKNGSILWQNANGRDKSVVAFSNASQPPKSIGNSITCPKDLKNEEQVNKVLLYLSEKISHRMYQEEMVACGIRIMVKDDLFQSRQYQQNLEIPSRWVKDIYAAAVRLFKQHYKWKNSVRALGVCGFLLLPNVQKAQVSFYTSVLKEQEQERLEAGIIKLKDKYGKRIVTYGTLLTKDFTSYIDDRINTTPYQPFQK